MSASINPELDLREQIVRIDRAIAESGKLAAEQAKLVAEQRKLNFESSKFLVEQRKLDAEGDKLRRDRAFVPVTVIATLMGAGGALVAATVALMKALGS